MDSWRYGHYFAVWRITPDFRLLKKQVIGHVASVLWVVMATVGLVMLIASVNVANLLLVRADSRQQELSIRAALGAGRARIARELLTESMLLGILGGVFSISVAYGGLELLKTVGTRRVAASQRGVIRWSFGPVHADPLLVLRTTLWLDPRN